MVRKTSIEAYNAIKENGLLSNRRWQVYDYVFRHGPVLARKVHEALSSQGTNSSSFISRFSELRDSGVLTEVGTAIDEKTGRTAILWDVTANLPAEIKNKPKQPKCSHCNGTGKEPQMELF